MRRAALIAYLCGVPLQLGPFPALAAADAAQRASACYVVSDPDGRAYCLAKAHGDPGRCYVIQRPDLRALCIAEVRR